MTEFVSHCISSYGYHSKFHKLCGHKTKIMYSITAPEVKPEVKVGYDSSAN